MLSQTYVTSAHYADNPINLCQLNEIIQCDKKNLY